MLSFPRLTERLSAGEQIGAYNTSFVTVGKASAISVCMSEDEKDWEKTDQSKACLSGLWKVC